MTREEEEARINAEIENNIKGKEIPAPEAPAKDKKEENTDQELLNAETPVRDELIDRINHTLNKIRPYIQADGGDVQFIDYKDGVVTVAMSGACAGCMMIDATLTDGIQAILLDEVPEVKKVELQQPVSTGMNGYYL
jgi:Fe-S cluster biogenesis protein NfuA